ncbi:hypothetical protein Patl1_32017 [Pistacia atlantica]|uniref:Uncharacterized protein n=1 Tax=Pistacia atlantica TaxID=434234 RepID=A0ACC1APL8_9ROSI|nr:hypothetical protein Patl1_32017 [Pistacia atlantica]
MERFAPRFYIAAATDNMSLQNARVFEDSLVHKSGVKGSSAQFMQIYRSREVGQSYITSVWTTLLAIAHALWLMIRIRPQGIKAEVMVLRVPHFTLSSLPAGHENRWSSVFYVESIAKLILKLKLYTSCTCEIQKPLVAFTKEDRGLGDHHLGTPVSSPQSSSFWVYPIILKTEKKKRKTGAVWVIVVDVKVGFYEKIVVVKRPECEKEWRDWRDASSTFSEMRSL